MGGLIREREARLGNPSYEWPLRNETERLITFTNATANVARRRMGFGLSLMNVYYDTHAAVTARSLR